MVTETKLPKDNLKETEEMINLITDQLLMGICIIQDNVIKYANKAVSKIIEYSIQEILEWPKDGFFKIFPPEELSIAMERVRKVQVKKKDIVKYYVYRIITKSTKTKWVEIYSNSIFYQGKDAILVLLIEITEKKRAEERLTGIETKLQKRLSELNHLYNISIILENPDISFDELFYAILEIIPRIFQFPEIASVKIIFENKEYKTKIFQETKWKLSYKVGINEKIMRIEVYYQEKRPFLDEEKKLLKEILHRLKNLFERRMAEQELKKSEAKQRETLNLLPDIVYEVNTDLNLTYANKVAFEKFGYSPEDVDKGLNLNQVISPKELDRAIRNIKSIFDGKILGPQDYLLRKKDGTEFWGRINNNPIYKDNKIIGMRGVISDITERKLMEEKLRIRDKAIETSINAIAITDLNGKLTYINPSFLNIWGYQNENEVLGRSLLEFWQSKEDAKAVIDEIKKKGSWVGEMSAKNKEGLDFFVQISASYIKDDNEKPIYIMGSFVNITRRKEAEDAAKFAYMELNQIFNTTGHGMRVIDKDFNILRVNDTLCNLWGMDRSQMEGKKCYDVFRSKSCFTANCPVTQVCEGKEHVEREIEKTFKNGMKNNFLLTASPYKNPHKEIIGIIEDYKDITERKRADEAQLKKIQLVDKKIKDLFSTIKQESPPILEKEKGDILLLYVDWDDIFGPVLKKNYPKQKKFSFSISRIGTQLFNAIASIYGQASITEAQGILLNIDNIKRFGYIFFDSYADENFRGGEHQYMLGLIAPNIDFFQSLEIKKILIEMSNIIKEKKNLDLEKFWKKVSEILLTESIPTDY